jgi:hypothetical protein
MSAAATVRGRVELAEIAQETLAGRGRDRILNCRLLVGRPVIPSDGGRSSGPFLAEKACGSISVTTISNRRSAPSPAAQMVLLSL